MSHRPRFVYTLFSLHCVLHLVVKMTKATTESQRPLTSKFSAYFISILFAGINSCMYLFRFVFFLLTPAPFSSPSMSRINCVTVTKLLMQTGSVDACNVDFLWLLWMSMRASILMGFHEHKRQRLYYSSFNFIPHFALSVFFICFHGGQWPLCALDNAQ